MTLFLGVDFGTGGVRAGLYDVERRRMLRVAESPYATCYPRLGWAEQSPMEWWRALGEACRALMAEACHPDIAGIGVATTSSTVVAAREDGTPLRPALLWMDCRAGAEATETRAARHPMMSAGGDAVEWLVPKAMWLARHELETYRQAARVCEAVDWVNHGLTGRWVGSRLNAVCKWNYDAVRRRHPLDLYEQLGVPELARKLPQEVLAVGETVAPLSAGAAEHLGIRGCPPVVQGGIDAHMAMLGGGATEPGDLVFIGGTSIVQLMHTANGTEVPGMWGPYADAIADDSWLIEGGQVSAGSILHWLAHTIFGLDDAGHQALIHDAMAMEPGDTGLLVLDYWMGNRTPYRSSELRGAILGLSLNHGRRDMYRASVEAIALGSANVFYTLRGQSLPIRRVVAAGGFQKNPLWLHATVDATGVPFEVADDDNLTLVGAAAAAACGAGLFADVRQAAAHVAARGRRIEPDPHAHEQYRALLMRYREATDSVGPVLSKPLPAVCRVRTAA